MNEDKTIKSEKNIKKYIWKIIKICVASVILLIIFVPAIRTRIAKNYNYKFLQYDESFEEKTERFSQKYYITQDVEGLIRTVIENNKGKTKVNMEYEGITYTEPQKLENLLQKLNTDWSYSVTIEYEKETNYIKTLKLEEYIGYEQNNLKTFRGNEIEGLTLPRLINTVNVYSSMLIINVTYTANSGEVKTVQVDEEHMLKMSEFSRDKLYNVEINFEGNDTVFISIIENE